MEAQQNEGGGERDASDREGKKNMSKSDTRLTL